MAIFFNVFFAKNWSKNDQKMTHFFASQHVTFYKTRDDIFCQKCRGCVISHPPIWVWWRASDADFTEASETRLWVCRFKATFCWLKIFGVSKNFRFLKFFFKSVLKLHTFYVEKKRKFYLGSVSIKKVLKTKEIRKKPNRDRKIVRENRKTVFARFSARVWKNQKFVKIFEIISYFLNAVSSILFFKKIIFKTFF